MATLKSDCDFFCNCLSDFEDCVLWEKPVNGLPTHM